MTKFLNSKFSGVIFVGIAILIAGCMLLFDDLKATTDYNKGVIDLNTMTREDFEEGRFVEGTINCLYDEYAYMEEYNSTLGIKHNERVTDHYYIMPLDSSLENENSDVVYVSVRLSKTSMVQTAETMINEFWSALETGTVPDNWTTMEFSGRIEKLDNEELLDFYYEWLMYGEESTDRAAYSNNVCMYTLSYYSPTAHSTLLPTAIVIMGIGAVVAVVGILLVKRENRGTDSVAADFSAPSGGMLPTGSSYTPVSGRTTTAPVDPETAYLMHQMESIPQPVDNADEFFSNPVKRTEQEKPAQSDNTPAPLTGEMDSIETPAYFEEKSGPGVGIDDE